MHLVNLLWLPKKYLKYLKNSYKGLKENNVEEVQWWLGDLFILMCENKEKNVLLFRDFAHAPSKVVATVKALREQYKDKYLLIVFELHTYSSLSEVFIDHYRNCLDNCDQAVVFYDPHAVAIKKLEMMSDERIVKGFARNDIKVVHSKDELLEVLNNVTKENLVGGFMSSGDFNGFKPDDFKIW